MAVFGINITKISIEKIGAQVGQVEVNLAPKVREVRLGELRSPTGKINGIEVLFEYNVTYRPEIAKALIEGMVFYLPPQKDKIDEILELWEKEKKVDPYMFAEIINSVTNEIIPILMTLTKEMRIPYPIPLPRVNVKTQG